jgi:hypothetical protein
MPVIDVHTHMLSRDWLELLRRHGKPRYEVRKSMDAHMKGCLARVDALPPGQRDAVRGANAVRVFGL